MPGSDYDRLPSDLQELIDELESILDTHDTDFQYFKQMPKYWNTIYSDEVMLRHDGVFSHTGAFGKEDEFTIDPTSYKDALGDDIQLRIKLNMRSTNGDAVFVRIRKNGDDFNPVCEWSTTSQTFVSKTKDLDGWAVDDTIELWMYGPSEVVYFDLCFDWTPKYYLQPVWE